MSTAGEVRPSLSRPLVLSVLLFVLFMKIPLFLHEPVDWDEGVYLYLSEHMGWALDGYTLQGSRFETELPHKAYSAPLFHHSPFVPYLIKILALFTSTLGAAKILNLALVFLSHFLVYRIAAILSGRLGGLIALSLWILCPIFNLESTLVHLDFPMTVFFLTGVWLLLRDGEASGRGWLLYAGGLAFAFAMLTKYTSPLYGIVAATLVLGRAGEGAGKRRLAVFFLLLSLGLAWHFAVLARYGSVMPAALIGNRAGEVMTTPYLQGIAKRHWYHLWLYFLGICPLFLLYLGAAARTAGGMARFFRKDSAFSSRARNLVLLNLSTVVCVILFSLINAMTNGYWIMRHIFPIYPVIYISLGAITATLWNRAEDGTKSCLAVFLFFNAAFMGASTFFTIWHLDSLRPVPALLLWIPGLRGLFY